MKIHEQEAMIAELKASVLERDKMATEQRSEITRLQGAAKDWEKKCQS